ncbi:MAG TPA: hypothetical protein VHF06_20355 [Pseudonocardiaceae bacterium]|jgi:hypothetical protein|nr:hypothetical protein [Pseudonocardiaceae bacterium]
MLLRVIGALLVIWLAFVVLGVVIKGLVILAVVGGIAFLGTAGYMAIRNNSRKRLP